LQNTSTNNAVLLINSVPLLINSVPLLIDGVNTAVLLANNAALLTYSSLKFFELSFLVASMSPPQIFKGAFPAENLII